MKEFFKSLKSLTLGLLIGGAALSTHAGLQVAGLGGTNNVPAAQTNMYYMLSSSVFYLGQTTDATISVGFNGFSTTDVFSRVFMFDASGDGVNWLSNWLSLSLAANYSNSVVLLTNLPAGYRPPFVRLNQIQCGTASTNYSTNVFVKCFTKDGF